MTLDESLKLSRLCFLISKLSGSNACLIELLCGLNDMVQLKQDRSCHRISAKQMLVIVKLP